MANSPAGRHLLGIKEKYPIVKVDPNGWHFLVDFKKDKPVYVAKFFCYEKVAKFFLPSLVKMEIYEKEYKKIQDNYQAFTHFSDLERNYKYPQIYLTTTPYYAGAGDGFVWTQSTVWNTVHDATTGTADSTGATVYVGVGMSGTNYRIRRGFFPPNTSGLPDSAEISAGLLYLWPPSAVNDSDNDGEDYIVVIGETTQADPTTLEAEDFDQCGAINNPTEGSDKIDLGNITDGQYNIWTLNATGISWIKKTAADPYTMLGVREGHDCLDHAYVGADGTNNSLYIQASEYTGIDQDPYLSVTYTVEGGAFLFNMV